MQTIPKGRQGEAPRRYHRGERRLFSIAAHSDGRRRHCGLDGWFDEDRFEKLAFPLIWINRSKGASVTER
jgi:hypothetical protein